MSIPILCDSPDLAEECATLAAAIGLPVDARATRDPVTDAGALLSAEPATHALGLVLSERPAIDPVVRVAEHASRLEAQISIACLAPAAPEELPPRLVDANLALDLGLVWVDELRPMLSALALQRTSIQRPWLASTRALSSLDRKRLDLRAGQSKFGRWRRRDQLLLLEPGEHALPIGELRDVAAALVALQHAQRTKRPPMPRVEGVDPQTVRDVIFGPPRALSDPASKAALAPYDVPFPMEELCGSPSRAASEATRIGFPVRLALASPDLRIWDHPDLAAESIDNAARVRDVFRQVMALAQQRAPNARLLGVTVSASTPAQATLELHLRPVDSELVLASIAFADPHGRASRDHTVTTLPATTESIARAVERLRGSRLLLEVMPNEQARSLGGLADVLLRLGSFVHEWRREVESVAVQPLAILPGGEVEAREVCVRVSDAFSRSMHTPASFGTR